MQHELFNLGSILATKPEDVHPKQPRITQTEIQLLETEIDVMNSELPELRSFVLPGWMPAECGIAHLPHDLPPRGEGRGGIGARRGGAARNRAVSEPAQ